MKKPPLIFIALLLFSTLSIALTLDGETPAGEDVCDGETGAAYGLCNDYCEAMDCDSKEPQASTEACSKVDSKFEKITGKPIPCVTRCPCFDAADLQVLGDKLRCSEVPPDGRLYEGKEGFALANDRRSDQPPNKITCAYTRPPASPYIKTGFTETELNTCIRLIARQCGTKSVPPYK